MEITKPSWEVKSKCAGCRNLRYGIGKILGEDNSFSGCKLDAMLGFRDINANPGLRCPLNNYMFMNRLSIIKGGKKGGKYAVPVL